MCTSIPHSIGLNDGVSSLDVYYPMLLLDLKKQIQRHCSQVGLQGWRGRASISRCINATFPSGPDGPFMALFDQPCVLMSSARRLCNILAHTSPMSLVK